MFNKDYNKNLKSIELYIKRASFLVLGGAGSIGQEIVKILFSLNPKKLHVIDLSENNLVELVRDLRSSIGYIDGDFKVYALDISSKEYDKFIDQDGIYDYVINLSALKHVRSEKDPFTIMRLIKTNILNVEKTIKHSIKNKTKKYFSVSTDKASNPANIMGASKKIMELIMFNYSNQINVSSARFANVLYSDGSLLYSFNQRFLKNQPIVAPSNIRRYFITSKEAAELCLLSLFLGLNRDIFYPKLDFNKDLKTFKEISINFLKSKGFKAYECVSEEQARKMMQEDLIKNKYWPCYFSKSETTGEKIYEEFYNLNEKINENRFENIGVIEKKKYEKYLEINRFKKDLKSYAKNVIWNREDILNVFKNTLSDFEHIEKGKFLDQKM